jgi:hypothetical protein
MYRMKRVITPLFLLFFILSASVGFSQSDRGRFYISGTSGAIFPFQKNNIAFKDKLIFGLEGNYFVANGVAITGGVDYLLGGEQTMAVFGTRLYPGSGSFYFRHKAMVNVKNRHSNDFLLGLGNDFRINDILAAELNLDYHFIYQALGLKFGLALTF